MCETSSDCNDRGFCINNQCLCDVAWFDDNCENNLKRTLPNAFITYRVIFLIIFSLIGLVSFIKLYLKIRKEKNLFIGSTFIFMLKSMRSPYILTMLSILGIFLTRIHWLAIDPFGYDDIFHRSLERVLFETTYSLLFVIYAIVLWVWGSIYEEIGLKRSQNGKRNLRWFKSKLMVFIVLVIAVQLTTSILKGYYIDRIRTATLIIYIALFAILVIVILEYCIYGWLLYKCISDQEKKIDAQFKIVKEKVKASAGHVESALGSLYDLPKKGDSEKSKGNILQDILEEDPDTPRSDENQNLNRLDSDFSGSPQKGRPSRSSQQPQQSVKIMGFEQLAKHDVNSLDNLESKGVGSVSNLDGPGTGHFGKSLSSPISKKQTLNHKSTIDMAFEVKVRKIVERHEAYLTPVEILEDFSHDNIAAEASVIFDDNDDVVWDFEDLNELKIKEEVQKVKKAEIERNKQNIIQSRQRTIIRTASTSVTKNRLADLYLQKLMDDPEYLDNHQKMTVKDKKVIKKIFSLTVIAICLEIVFVVITILIFGTPVLQSPAGMIISMWITGFIEVFAITAIILLFSLVDSQENDNLRIIMRLGQNKNRINRLYGFTLPPYLRKEESKKKLEKRINQTTTGYLHSLESIPG